MSTIPASPSKSPSLTPSSDPDPLPSSPTPDGTSLTTTLYHYLVTTNYRTFVPAFLFSTFINIGLPFINGAMLGFGELWARDYVGVYFGWTHRSPPASSALGTRANTAGSSPGHAGLKTAVEAVEVEVVEGGSL
ncbi:mitochondrial outer membrane protein, MIM1/TOM13 [Pseudohyphozyma bogoriensis]|nr:mitochondrial outer membrane protein, MIM1/TOM13 [Pseudohyphozyma bogoriensis]